jgi:hypothetical protein
MELGIDPFTEEHLLWIARAALNDVDNENDDELRATVAQERQRVMQSQRHQPAMYGHPQMHATGSEMPTAHADAHYGTYGVAPGGVAPGGAGAGYHPAAAAAFGAAVDPTAVSAKDRDRKERKERKEQVREREHGLGNGAANNHAANNNVGGGPLSPHNRGDKENKENRRDGKVHEARTAAKAAMAAMEASHRVATKGLQRRVASLEQELSAKDETFMEERMRLELEVNRAIIDKVEAAEARLAEERGAMQADLQAAISLERQMASEEATKAVKEEAADNTRRREVEASRLAAREEALTEELGAERVRTSELISIISQQSRDLAKGGSDVAAHLVALEQAAGLKEAEARRVLQREREEMEAGQAAALTAAEERGRAAAAAEAERAAHVTAAKVDETARRAATELATAVSAAAAAATGGAAETDQLRRQLDDANMRRTEEAAKRAELERLLDAAEHRTESAAIEAAAEATARAGAAAHSAVTSEAGLALDAERRRARSGGVPSHGLIHRRRVSPHACV